MDEFWINNPKVLLNKQRILEIWPQSGYSMERKLNAITRIVLFLSLIGYMFTRSMKIIVSFVVTVVAIVILYKTQKKEKIEGFDLKNNMGPLTNNIKLSNKTQNTAPTEKNPFMNVLINEYVENPTREKAMPVYNKNVHEEIKEIIKGDNKKLYQNLGDNLSLEHSLRGFHTMPNTTIPNKQKEFAMFCYGNMKSCKDGDDLQCLKNNDRL